MSDNWLVLIPTSPEYVPSKDAQERAIALFKEIAPEAHEIRVELSTRPRLIDCGANLTKINCPCCRALLDVEWWSHWISEEAIVGFPLKPAVLPCCRTLKSLADLDYDWPLGFARFSLGGMNPNIQDLPAAVDEEFAAILGCGVRRIWRHI